MPYGPHTADDRARMLAALGLTSVDELFEDIPVALRRLAASTCPIPSPSSSWPPGCPAWPPATGRTSRRSWAPACTATGRPPAVDQLLLRGEWYTAYTPYQPEVSQGTLQSIYEYESLIAELVDLDVVSASHYDGAAATAEAALMTCRATAPRAGPRSRAACTRTTARRSRTYFEGGPRARGDPARRPMATAAGHDGPGGASSGCSPSPAARSPASIAAAARLPRAARADGRDRPARPRAPARCSSPSSSRSPSRSSRRRAPTARTSPPARASRSASRRSTAARISGSSPAPTRSSARSRAGWSA